MPMDQMSIETLVFKRSKIFWGAHPAVYVQHCDFEKQS
jgi:hypothetical protein